MTNAIETTKHEMYVSLGLAKETASLGFVPNGSLREFESKLEAHLEQLRQQYEQMAATAHDRFETVQSLEQANEALTMKNDTQRQIIEDAGGTNELRYQLSVMTEERDAMRNQLQALQMASQTAAEVIRGLRSELLEARECNATGHAKDAPKTAHADPYTMGFNTAGFRGCPFPINTIERLHWMDGAREKLRSTGQ